jgi:hypothetical protein
MKTTTRQLLNKLTEDDGQPGYDIPPDGPEEEREEVLIGRQILHVLRHARDIDLRGVDQVKQLAQRLIDMHTPQEDKPHATTWPGDLRTSG